MARIRLFALFLASSFSYVAIAQSASEFPKPSFELADAKHKQGTSGVQMGPGNSITIVSGQGTPTTINVLAFSGDGKLLAAGKDFGRVVVWDVSQRKFICALDTGEGIVTAVSVSKDGQGLVTAGQGDSFAVKLWSLPDGKLLRTYDDLSRLRAFAHIWSGRNVVCSLVQRRQDSCTRHCTRKAASCDGRDVLSAAIE